MNCCGCNKKLNFDNETDKDGNTLWYGKYKGWQCVKAICNECIKDPIKKDRYRND